MVTLRNILALAVGFVTAASLLACGPDSGEERRGDAISISESDAGVGERREFDDTGISDPRDATARSGGDAGDATPRSRDIRPDSGTPDDADVGVADGRAPDGVRVEATSAEVQTDFRASVVGDLSESLSGVELTDNSGWIRLGGEQISAFAYRLQNWDAQGQTLVQTLAVRGDALYVLWLYCSDSTLDGAYYEGTDGTPMTWVPANSGTCDLSTETRNVQVDLPAVSFAKPSADHAFEVTGGDLEIRPGKAGTFEADPRDWTVFGFETVDCTSGCGDPGWWELHAILWNEQARELCFSIFYLFEGTRDPRVSYSMCLPSARDKIGDRTIGGTWSR